MSQNTDEELIRRTVAGDQSAFAELVRRYQRRVTVTIRSVVGDLPREDLADIAQDIFLIVFKALPSFRGDATFGTYLTRIALRHCYRESKRRRRRRMLFMSNDSRDPDRPAPEELLVSGSRADQGVVLEERKRAVLKAMENLPEEFRTVLVLRIVEEMSVEEVGESLGIETGTVKSRLYRAKEKMRELLTGSSIDFEPGTVD